MDAPERQPARTSGSDRIGSRSGVDLAFLLLVISCLPLPGCSEPAPAPVPEHATAGRASEAAVDGEIDVKPGEEPSADARGVFVDVAGESGLDFVHFNGMSGELYYSEMMGSGAALFDADGDGDLDLYLVQGGMLPPERDPGEATFPPTPGMLPLRDRLYRNDPEVDATGRRQPRFVDVTEASGLDARGYGMGVATGDYDRDGRVDLYVTNAGSNQLWRNTGPDGEGRVTFADVTAEAGVDDPRWSLSATWVDVDRDGWLDLYVTNYVDYTLGRHVQCRMISGRPDYCGPQAFEPVGDSLFRNLGPGESGAVRFEDVTASSGIGAVRAAGMGVVAGEIDGDGRPDLYVSNDASANFLWLGQADGAFRDGSLESGTALNREGRAEAGMGIALGDPDGDADPDLFVSHTEMETNTLYRNDGGSFEDVTVAAGLGAPSFATTGFGTAWIDVDNDGWLDLLTVNGAVLRIPELIARGDPHPLGLPNQLFRNLEPGAGGPRFEEHGSPGEAFRLRTVSRGLAIGDVDGDGDSDAVVTNNAGPVQLLLNRIGQDRHWVGLRPVDGDPARDVPGAVVEIPGRSGPRAWARVSTGGSYLSASDPRILFGLGDDPEIGEVSVRWPDGTRETLAVEVDRYSTLRRGSGRPAGERE